MSTAGQYILVAPNVQFTWSFDFAPLLAEGETILSHQWSITPPAPLQDTDREVVFVMGLVAGIVY
jgi:hypothetical protein